MCVQMRLYKGGWWRGCVCVDGGGDGGDGEVYIRMLVGGWGFGEGK